MLRKLEFDFGKAVRTLYIYTPALVRSLGKTLNYSESHLKVMSLVLIKEASAVPDH